MVTITQAVIRKNSKNEEFVALILTSGVEMVKAKSTNKFYATVRTASVPSTLSLELAKEMVGQRMKGMIVKNPCDPYLYKTHSGEEIELTWSYIYTDEPENLTEEVFS